MANKYDPILGEYRQKDTTSEGNVIVLNPSLPEIGGIQHQTFASAFAWIVANSPASSSNQWCVKFSGTITENIVIPRYVTVSGEDRNNSFINGTVDCAERGDDWTSVTNKLQNCRIATLAITNTIGGGGKGIVLYNVSVTNSVASGANHYIDATLCEFEGDYSSFTGTGGTNAKTVIRNSNISSWAIPTTLATAGWYLVGCTFGNAGNALTLAGQSSFIPLYLKDCYFESYATITFVGTINWSDCEFNAGAADIVIPNGVTFNVANTTFRSNITVNSGGTLNSVDVVLEVGKSITNNGTWTNKGESYNNASSGLTGADTQSAIDEVYAETLHLDQTTPQTVINGVPTFNVGIITPKIYPATDSTTALQITKADGTTGLMNFDTTDSRLTYGGTTLVASVGHLFITPANYDAIHVRATNGYQVLKFEDLTGTARAWVGNPTGSTFEFKNFTSGGHLLLTTTGAGNVGINTTTPTARLHLPEGTATAGTAPLKFVSGAITSASEAGAIEFLGDDYYATISSGAGGTSSQYPPTQTTTYVKATSTFGIGTSYAPYWATNPLKSLIGAATGNCWLTTSTSNQRFHIDLGTAKVIDKIYYENYHNTGGSTNYGVKNFTFWGSNDVNSFTELTYGTDTGWTQITTSQLTFDQHSGSNAVDPKYITATNTTSYRYYAFKFADAWGSSYLGVRRIELQLTTGFVDGRKNIVLTDSGVLTSGRIPYCTTNGRLMDDTNFKWNASTGLDLGVKDFRTIGKAYALTAALGTTANYTEFDATGHQTMAGLAKPWRDALSDAISLQQTGTGISRNPTESSVDYTTASNLNDFMYCNIQLNHDKDLSSPIYPHIHYMQNQPNTPNFCLQYRWQVQGGQKTTSWTKYKCNTNAIPYSLMSGTSMHQIAYGALISTPAGSSLSDIVQFKIYRDNANALSLCSGADPYTGTVGVLAFDLHFQINSLGSTDEYTK